MKIRTLVAIAVILALAVWALPRAFAQTSQITVNGGASALISATPSLTPADGTAVSGALTYIFFQQANGGAWTILGAPLTSPQTRTQVFSAPGIYCYTFREVEAPGLAANLSASA